jgi:sialidase-1
MKTILVGIWLAGALTAAPIAKTDLYVGGEGGYHTYRIPALIVSAKGTLLAFCEGRRNGSGDSGEIDVVLRRSLDGGKTWLQLQVVANGGGDPIGNPTPVVERKTGTIFLLLTRNPGSVTEGQIVQGAAAQRTVWIMHSTDDGATWSRLEEITAQVSRPDWTWYATGPGNGIQLRSGRLVAPCDHDMRDGRGYSHVIYSDDRGASWRIGGVAGEKTNESAVAELKNGDLLLNMRNDLGKNRRAVERSRDGGLTWGPLELDETLVEPVCEGSLVAAAPAGRKSDGRLLFSNPAAVTRTHLTVRLSKDDGRTWAASRLVEEGPSAYSSLAVLGDGTAGLLYERGDRNPYERITFAHFPIAWVEGK